MNQTKAPAKRRKWKRFKLKGGAIVLLRKIRFIEVGSPSYIELGPVVDISMGGLATQYVDSKQRRLESEELAISVPSNGVKIGPIPFKVVSDREVARMPDGKIIRNRCVKFGKLDDYRFFQIESFIKEYTMETGTERRSGLERRQYQDPKFHESEYSTIYERRSGEDRRNA